MSVHIEAAPGDIAETVLMPGDPLRARFIAENFLDDAVLYNSIRGMLGYTGLYKGERLSVQGSGIGMPSMGIYAHELFEFFGVKNIIRVGTAGSVARGISLREVIIAAGASTNSNFLSQYGLPGHFACLADFDLLSSAVKCAQNTGNSFRVGNVLTSDHFYNDDPQALISWQKMGVLAVEMECAALYATAARLGRRALCILTISDDAITGEATTPAERQESFTDMIKIALEVTNATRSTQH